MTELLRQALTALEHHTQQTRPIHDSNVVIVAIHAHLAQSAPAPVAYIAHYGEAERHLCWHNPGGEKTPLYASPQAVPSPVVMVGASTARQILDALEGAHWLSGPPHERIKQLVESLSAAPVVREPQETDAERFMRYWQDTNHRCHVLLDVIGVVREYPDFDAGGPLADMMDAALEGRTPDALIKIAELRSLHGIGTQGEPK